MKSLWQNDLARQFNTPLALRVYTSRLLGQEPSLVLHGGGNTSVKDLVTNLFGEQEEILYVKGSGWDLATIAEAGFAPVKMSVLMKMAQLTTLSDSDMVKYQRAAMLDPNAPNPSVEAILHAIIPFKFVDHTHADAIVTLTNTPNGDALIQELYGKRVVIIPYVMPGFALAKLVYDLTKTVNWQEIEGLVLMNHGLFTFADDAKTAYEKTIELVTEAESFIAEKQSVECQMVEGATPSRNIDIDLHELAKIRQSVSVLKGHAVVAVYNHGDAALAIATQENVGDIATRGPLTPDHVIRTKRLPVILQHEPQQAITQYCQQYEAYFVQHQTGHTMLNAAPNFAIWQNKGAISFGKTMGEAAVISDISNHTFAAIMIAEKIASYQALSAQEIFEVEYWELEQAKLKKTATAPMLQGKVVLLSTASSELMAVCAKTLTDLGANVALVTPEQTASAGDCQVAVDAIVKKFGGIDIVICAADQPQSRELVMASQGYLAYGINATIVCLNEVFLPTIAPDSLNILSVRYSPLSTAVDIASTITLMLSPTYSGTGISLA